MNAEQEDRGWKMEDGLYPLSSVVTFRALTILALSLLLAPAPMRAQQTIKDKVDNFRVALDFFEPPHDGQMKSLLEGAQAQQLPDKRFLVTGVKLQKFHEDGGLELLIKTPECYYDPADHS